MKDGRKRFAACAAALAVCAGLTGAAAAQANTMTNGGFESGDLRGWSSDGAAAAVTSYGDFKPVWGRHFGIASGGCPTHYLAQQFKATAGESLYGWSFFQAGDYNPFSDTGDVKLQMIGGGTTETLFASGVSQVGDYGHTPWRAWSYTFPSTGTYTLAATSANVGDCGFDSTVGIDLTSRKCGKQSWDYANAVLDRKQAYRDYADARAAYKADHSAANKTAMNDKRASYSSARDDVSTKQHARNACLS